MDYDKSPIRFFAPGRVNLIGEHIDYNGGVVMPVTISLGVYADVNYRDDNTIRIASAGFDGEVNISLDDTLSYDKTAGWTNYPIGVIKTMLEANYKIKGFNAYFSSTLPQGAGLSSSAAIEILTGCIAAYSTTLNDEDIDRKKLAEICQKAENNFIGVNCGIMDQFAIALGKKDFALLLNTVNLKYQYIPIKLDKYSLVILNTNKSRKLSSSQYNQRLIECQQALDILNQSVEVDNLVDATLLEINKYIKDTMLNKRAKHVVSENQRVFQVMSQLQQGHISKFGEILNSSHESLRDNFEVSCPELDTIVNEAIKQKECFGARMVGAGFGGCAIAIVETHKLKRFEKHVGHTYKSATGLEAEFYVCDIVDGVSVVK